MIQVIDTKDLFQILDNIVYEKSKIYILERKLDLLYSWIRGYEVGANANKSEFKNLDKLNDFSIFVHKRNKDEFENTFGWFGSIRAIHGGGEEGFDNFCKLYREFRDTEKGNFGV